jgi:hypothetical protein
VITPSEEPSSRYVIVESDRFDSDRDRVVLSVYRLLGPERANEWAKGLARAISGLTGFPGPLSHARDEEAAAFYGQEVRRMLFYGPTRRRSGTPVRLLFTIAPPAPDEPSETAESAIILLRLLSGGQTLSPEEMPE